MMDRPRNIRKRRGEADDCGAAAVELAIIVPVFLILVLGIIDYSGMTHTAASLLGATRAATEYAKANWANPAVDAATGTEQQLCSFWGSTLANGSCSSVAPSVAPSCTCVDGTAVTCPTATASNPCAAKTDTRVLVYVSATATDAYTPILPVTIFGLPNQLSATATTRLQ